MVLIIKMLVGREDQCAKSGKISLFRTNKQKCTIYSKSCIRSKIVLCHMALGLALDLLMPHLPNWSFKEKKIGNHNLRIVNSILVCFMYLSIILYFRGDYKNCTFFQNLPLNFSISFPPPAS